MTAFITKMKSAEFVKYMYHAESAGRGKGAGTKGRPGARGRVD